MFHLGLGPRTSCQEGTVRDAQTRMRGSLQELVTLAIGVAFSS